MRYADHLLISGAEIGLEVCYSYGINCVRIMVYLDSFDSLENCTQNTTAKTGLKLVHKTLFGVELKSVTKLCKNRRNT